jgi:hypothetical protein
MDIEEELALMNAIRLSEREFKKTQVKIEKQQLCFDNIILYDIFLIIIKALIYKCTTCITLNKPQCLHLSAHEYAEIMNLKRVCKAFKSNVERFFKENSCPEEIKVEINRLRGNIPILFESWEYKEVMEFQNSMKEINKKRDKYIRFVDSEFSSHDKPSHIHTRYKKRVIDNHGLIKTACLCHDIRWKTLLIEDCKIKQV